MNYKYISSKEVLGRVARMVENTDFLDFGQVYLYDVIRELGTNLNLVTTVTKPNELIPVINHRAGLPCELVELLFVETELGFRLKYNKNHKALDCYNFQYPVGSAALPYQFNEDNNTQLPLNFINPQDISKISTQHYYYIDGENVITSIETGYLRYFYRIFETDDGGYLKIPDESNYKEAIVWYILGKLSLEGYELKNKNLSYPFCSERYDEYAHRAKVKKAIMSKDQRYRLARMINSYNSHFVEPFIMTRENYYDD